MDVPFALILDISLAFLLVVTILYAIVLNKRLGTLRSDRKELEALAASFGDATKRAGDSIGRLKTAGDALNEQLSRAETLRDDMVFLIDRGTATADRLEETVREARDDLGVQPSRVVAEVSEIDGKPIATRAAPRVMPKPVNGDERVPAPEPRSEAEKALLKALKSAS